MARTRAGADESAMAMKRAALVRRAARAIDEPISPTPMMAIRSKIGWASGAPSFSVTIFRLPP